MATQDVRLMAEDGTTPLTMVDLRNRASIPVSNNADAACRGVAAIGTALDTEKPIFIGGFASASIASATAVLEGELNWFKGTSDGRLVTHPYTVPQDVIVMAPVLLANDTSVHTLIAAITDMKICLLGGFVSTTSSTAAHIIIADAAGPSELARIPHVNGAHLIPLPKIGSLNTNMTYQMSAQVGASAAYFTPVAYKTGL